MEERLKVLVESTKEENRTKYAFEWRKQGKKVIGLLCSYIPEEVIYAAGMLPWHVTAVGQTNISRALTYRSAISSLYCNAVLESLLRGELDFLDGVIATNREQDLVRLWDVWVHLEKTPFAHILDIPRRESSLSYGQMAKEITRLIGLLEKFGGSKITETSLSHAIGVYNKTRDLLGRLYELRKREVPPLSGAEAMAIVAASTIMPKDEFNHELETLFPYIEERKTSLKHVRPRLLVSSDTLHDPSFIDLAEQTGCLVAMDDLDPGSRYFWQTVDADHSDPVEALAERYLQRPAHPRMHSWDKQAQTVIDWVKEFSIDGVLEMPEKYSIPREFRVPFFRNRLKEAGIPNMSIPRFYNLTEVGQLRLRIEAFRETLDSPV
jgi:benzoyl-CoA reductase/2-hydroxyglutaryl-CoA dehydratase subunit BcrC/BadD/HgdB